jgi:hypothetical protein
MAIRVRGISAASVVAGSLLFAGCSSGTEPPPIPPVEFAVSISTTPSAVRVGDTVYATLTIENVTSAPITRNFSDLFYPRVLVANGSDNLRDLLIFSGGIPSTTLTLAPHESVSGVSAFYAFGEGEGDMTGCLPADVSSGDPAVCADASIAIRER